jgi:hypothetical protein
VAALPEFPDFLQAWVTTQEDLTALLGAAGPRRRLRPWQAARKDSPPKVTYTLVSSERVRGLPGPFGVLRQRWQLDCYGATAQQTRELARMFSGNGTPDQRLDGFRGTLAGVKVQSCVLEDERDNSEALTPGDDAGSPCVQLDFACAWNVVNP